MRITAAIQLVTAFYILISAIAVRSEVLFSDDFEDGLDSSWLHASRWTAENGKLYYTGPNDNERFLCGGSPERQLYYIGFDFCRCNDSDELGFMVMSPYAPTPGVQPSGYEIFLSNEGYGFMATPGHILLESDDPQLIMQTGIPYRVEFGYISGHICYRHWPLGTDIPEWHWVSDYDGMFESGYWYIFVNSYDTGSWIDNFVVGGSSVVPSELMSWGTIKLLFD